MAIDAADYTRARQILHNLKGVSANLAIKDLQQATVGLEKLLKNEAEDKLPASDAVYGEITVLESTLDQVLKAIQTLGPAARDDTTMSAADQIDTVSPDIAKDTARRLREAAEMGDVTEIVSIGEEIASGNQAFMPYKEKITQLADDFDFEGILKLAAELDKFADTKSE
jgi:HPt (histidine-containing phosphotransfer) domain-containing protein